MSGLLGNYLAYARGERANPLWSVFNIFAAAVRPLTVLRNALYDRGVFASEDPPLPVISVGNLCHGGTNKTPMVEVLSRELTKAGFSVGVVSRGYSGETRKPLWIGNDERSLRREIAGDEPLMLAERLPEVKVVVSGDRREGVRLLASLGVDVVVADDAFQHRRMGRDLDIVLIDAACPFGNGRVVPAGILRETPESLRRADIVILTKAEQVDEASLEATKKIISGHVAAEDIFTARVKLESWLALERGEWRACEPERGRGLPGGRLVAFSAIANPDSFKRSLQSFGVNVLDHRIYRDHHRFSLKDIDDMERRARELGADGFVCTEKDLHNLPKNPILLRPLYVPCITVSLDDPGRFWSTVARKLRPNLVVASNGYGEDAIGAVLADLLCRRFQGASVSAFALVGNGRAYRDRGIPVFSPPSEMPSGGIVKYSLRALARDIRYGLYQDIKKQIGVWRARAGKFRTPLCVGDGYLLAHTVWGQGLTPLLVATAKSVHLRRHWMVERALLRRRCLRVWTRDEETAEALRAKGVRAVFTGSPIMDLALDKDDGSAPWEGLPRPRVLLLPGSRPRAYEDVSLLLDAVGLLSAKRSCGFLMVVAPTIDRERLFSVGACARLEKENAVLTSGACVRLYTGPVASAARGADLLIGLGGTANQVSAGLGVPVLSIEERGKLSQKKLLQDAELLVAASAAALAGAASELLGDLPRLNAMSEAGIKRLGGPGALSSVVGYAAEELGWDKRFRLWRRLSEVFFPSGALAPENEDNEENATAKEAEVRWVKAKRKHIKLMRLVRMRRAK